MKFISAGNVRHVTLTLGMAVALSGCTAMTQLVDPPRSEVESELNSTKVVVKSPPSIALANEHAQRFALMALFAQTTYRYDIPEKKRRGRGCEYQEQGAGYMGVVTYQMPESDKGHWERWLEPGSCVDEGGLFFETYVHTSDKTPQGKAIKPDMAVISFRGTENYDPYEFMHDWGSNLSGAVPVLGSEYQRALEQAMPIIEKLHNGTDGKSIPIYLTGHSLGGGLAQQLAYVADKMVTATYAFDSSPSSHWTQLRSYEQKRDPLIYRVSQRREVLSYPRMVSTAVNDIVDTRYRRSDYIFDFTPHGGVEAHAMSYLTCEFARMLKDSANEGTANEGIEFDYSKAAARKTLEDKVLCPNSI